MEKDYLLLIDTEDDGSIRIQFGDENPLNEGVSAAGYAILCAIFANSEGMLEASSRLINLFKELEDVLLEYYSDSKRLSDEDVDKIADVVLSDPLSGEVTRIRSGGDGHDPT